MRDEKAAAVTLQHVRVLEKWDLLLLDDFCNAAHVVGPFVFWAGIIIRCFQIRNSGAFTVEYVYFYKNNN